MAIVATACRHARNRRVRETPSKARAGAMIIGRVLVKRLGQAILCGGRDHADAQVTRDTNAVRVPALPPRFLEVETLIDRAGYCGSRKCYRSDGVFDIIVKPLVGRRTDVIARR